MSNRQLKKINKEDELKANLNFLSEINSDEEVEELEVLPSIKKGGKNKKKAKGKVNAFDLLLNDDEDDNIDDADLLNEELLNEEELEEIEEEVIPKPKQKTQNKQQQKKKKKGKSNQQQNKNKQKEEFSLEELEKEVEKIKLLDNNNASTSAQDIKAQKHLQLKEILKVLPKNLDPDQETIRIFGSKIVKNELKNKRYAKLTKKYILSTPREFWPRPHLLGLNMEVTDNLTDEGVVFYTFTQNQRYREIQRHFYHAINTHDPNSIMGVSQLQPYHLDSLLMLSEIAKQSGDIGTAGEMIERALFASELAFHPNFNLVGGNCRLDYNRLENRSFFLALYRHLQFLARKGCWRTCLEFNKLILSLNPIGDPLNSILNIDYFSLQSNEYQYLLDFTNYWQTIYPVDSLPNLVYSRILANFQLSKKNPELLSLAVDNLTFAIIHYPELFLKLIEKCGIAMGTDLTLIRNHATKFTKSIKGAQKSQILLLSQIYLERSYSPWKEVDTIEFLQQNIQTVLQALANLDAETQESYESLWLEDSNSEISLKLSRHAIISEFDSLRAYLPSDVLNKAVYMHDPLPPLESVSLYDDYKIVEDLQRSRASVFGQGLGEAMPQLMDRIMEGFNALINQANEEGRNVEEVINDQENPGFLRSFWERLQTLNPLGNGNEGEDGEEGDDDEEVTSSNEWDSDNDDEEQLEEQNQN